jgi:hypothetical protein
LRVFGGQTWPRGHGAQDGGAPKKPPAQTQAVEFVDTVVVFTGQDVQEVAPDAAEKVPRGHTVALTEENGQKEPGGQRTGAPEEQ